MPIAVCGADADDRSVIKQPFACVFDLNNHAFQRNRNFSREDERVELEAEACSFADEAKTDALGRRHVAIHFETGGKQLAPVLPHWSDQNGMEEVTVPGTERRDEIF
jgi:hypothetical protein